MTTETTASTAPVFVRRGRGTKVHVALLADGKIFGTACVASPLAGGRMESRLAVTDGPATCLLCTGGAAAPVAKDAAPVVDREAEAAKIADRSARFAARKALMEQASATLRAGDRDEALRLMAEAEAIDTSL